MKRIQIDHARAEQLAADGKTNRQMAAEFGMKQGSFDSRLNRDEPLREAVKRGRERARSEGKRPGWETENRVKMRKGREPKAAPRGERQAAPEKPAQTKAATFERGEDAKVYEALGGGPLCRAELRGATGLSYDQINDALYRLRFERSLVGMVEGKTHKEFFFVLGDEDKAAARAGLASTGGHDAPGPRRPEAAAAEPASDRRLARTAEPVKGRREKAVKMVGERGPEIFIPESPGGNDDGHVTVAVAEPPVTAAAVAEPTTSDSEARLRVAAEAALLELDFREFWGEPSHKAAVVRRGVHDALHARAGEGVRL